jgi:hypothetical protein
MPILRADVQKASAQLDAALLSGPEKTPLLKRKRAPKR